MSNPNRSTKQWVLAGGCIFAGSVALYFVAQVLNSSDAVLARSNESGVTSSMIAERTRAASPEMSWITDASERLKTSQEKIEKLEQRYEELEARRQRDIETMSGQTDDILSAYEQKIQDLQSQLASAATTRPTQASVNPLASALSNRSGVPGEIVQPVSVPGAAFRQTPLGNVNSNGSAPSETITATAVGEPSARAFSTDFNLSNRSEAEQDASFKSLRNFLPAGSYAPAVVLSGVDAPTNVSSQTDPIPVLFRISGPAVTAGTRSTRGHTIDLTGCTVTGSAKGDLSSERVLVRLIKMSCVLGEQRVFERDVAGYMSGRGKAGARGHVVSREGPLVTNAGIAGALGGLADGLSSVGKAGAGAETASFENALRGAGAASASGGAGNAANTLSEYYIERAEQYQPVVSLYGGTNVELVFMEGVSLDG